MLSKALTTSLLFDVFKLKVEDLKNCEDIKLYHNAKRYYNEAICLNQKLVNEIITEIKIKNQELGNELDLIDLYDDYSMFIYSIVSLLERLSTNKLIEFIEYINDFEVPVENKN